VYITRLARLYQLLSGDQYPIKKAEKFWKGNKIILFKSFNKFSIESTIIQYPLYTLLLKQIYDIFGRNKNKIWQFKKGFNFITTRQEAPIVLFLIMNESLQKYTFFRISDKL
jgi:hypothetical protein